MEEYELTRLIGLKERKSTLSRFSRLFIVDKNADSYDCAKSIALILKEPLTDDTAYVIDAMYRAGKVAATELHDTAKQEFEKA